MRDLEAFPTEGVGMHLSLLQDAAMSPTVSPGDRQVHGTVSGEFVTQAFEYNGGRQVTVYVPPDPPEFIVFGGDGQLIAQWGGDLEATDLPSTMVVGLHRQTDETLRLHEYSPRFARSGSRHMRGSSSAKLRVGFERGSV